MALLSLRREFNQKIIQVHALAPALAPAIIMENFSHPVMKLVMDYRQVRILMTFKPPGLSKSGVFQMYDYKELNPIKYNGSGGP